MLMFHLYYIGCVFVYLMYIYLSSEINIYLSIYLSSFLHIILKHVLYTDLGRPGDTFAVAGDRAI